MRDPFDFFKIKGSCWGTNTILILIMFPPFNTSITNAAIHVDVWLLQQYRKDGKTRIDVVWENSKENEEIKYGI